jgi:hypothetical protein
MIHKVYLSLINSFFRLIDYLEYVVDIYIKTIWFGSLYPVKNNNDIKVKILHIIHSLQVGGAELVLLNYEKYPPVERLFLWIHDKRICRLIFFLFIISL